MIDISGYGDEEYPHIRLKAYISKHEKFASKVKRAPMARAIRHYLPGAWHISHSDHKREFLCEVRVRPSEVGAMAI